MIEDETFDEIDDALDITDRGAEIMKAPVNKPTRTSPKNIKSGKEDITKAVSYTHLTLPTKA